MARSIEEKIVDITKSQLERGNYSIQTADINPEIAMALKMIKTKSGSDGINYPDLKLLLVSPTGRRIPAMIECKGIKGLLCKMNSNDEIDLFLKNGYPNYKVIKKYAVNGAVHYAYAVLNYCNSYKELIAVGVNGYEENGKLFYEVGVYYISKTNGFIPKKIDNLLIYHS